MKRLTVRFIEAVIDMMKSSTIGSSMTVSFTEEKKAKVNVQIVLGSALSALSTLIELSVRMFIAALVQVSEKEGYDLSKYTLSLKREEDGVHVESSVIDSYVDNKKLTPEEMLLDLLRMGDKGSLDDIADEIPSTNNQNMKKQRVTINIDGVEHKGIVTSQPSMWPGVIDIKMSGLVTSDGTKHEDIEQTVMNLRVGNWEEKGLEITALEDLPEVEIPV